MNRSAPKGLYGHESQSHVGHHISLLNLQTNSRTDERLTSGRYRTRERTPTILNKNTDKICTENLRGPSRCVSRCPSARSRERSRGPRSVSGVHFGTDTVGGTSDRSRHHPLVKRQSTITSEGSVMISGDEPDATSATSGFQSNILDTDSDVSVCRPRENPRSHSSSSLNGSSSDSDIDVVVREKKRYAKKYRDVLTRRKTYEDSDEPHTPSSDVADFKVAQTKTEDSIPSDHKDEKQEEEDIFNNGNDQWSLTSSEDYYDNATFESDSTSSEKSTKVGHKLSRSSHENPNTKNPNTAKTLLHLTENETEKEGMGFRQKKPRHISIMSTASQQSGPNASPTWRQAKGACAQWESFDLVNGGEGDGVTSRHCSQEQQYLLRGTTKEEVEMRKYKLGVMKKIMKEFNLEATLNKYRRLSVVDYTVNPGDHSFDCTMSATQFQRRLVELTGSSTVRVNDHDYLSELKKKIEEERNIQQKRDEERRANGEIVRMRRLLERGCITLSDLRRDIIGRRDKVIHDAQNTAGQLMRSRSQRQQLNARLSTRPRTTPVRPRTSPAAHRGKDTRRTRSAPPLPRIAVHRDKIPRAANSATCRPTPSPRPQSNHHSPRDASPLFFRSTTPDQLTCVQNYAPLHLATREFLSPNLASTCSEVSQERDTNTSSLKLTHNKANVKIKHCETLNNEGETPRRYKQFQEPLLNEIQREETVNGLYRLAEELFLAPSKPKSRDSCPS